VADDEHEKQDRPMGKSTLTLSQKKLEVELEEKRIAADLEAKRIAAAAELEKAKLAVADRDGERDDRRSTVRIVLAGVAVLVALGLVALGLAWGRDLSFSGFGFNATTGDATPPTEPAPPAP
jgi:hypothetical protein